VAEAGIGGGVAARAGTREEDAAVTGGYDFKPPVALTCPRCGGALADTTEGSLPYFACHIGHRYASADMDDAQFREMEKALEVALRSLGERAALCRRMAETARGRGAASSAGQWEDAKREVEERREVLRRFLEKGWRRPDPEGDVREDEAAG
jgi:two-component system chemotaxis response regulator CheB